MSKRLQTMYKNTTLLSFSQVLIACRLNLFNYSMQSIELIKSQFAGFLDSPLGVGSKRASAIPLVITRNVLPLFTFGGAFRV